MVNRSVEGEGNLTNINKYVKRSFYVKVTYSRPSSDSGC